MPYSPQLQGEIVRSETDLPGYLKFQGSKRQLKNSRSIDNMPAVNASVIQMAVAIVRMLFRKLASIGNSGMSSSGKELLAGGLYGFTTDLPIRWKVSSGEWQRPPWDSTDTYFQLKVALH